jgi:co-chaperonin GroES (HSP10)
VDAKPRPCNRHLLVKVCESETEEGKQSEVILPEDYYSKSRFGKAKVLSRASDCTVDVLVGECIVYENSMLEEVKIDGQTHNMILENYILCVL